MTSSIDLHHLDQYVCGDAALLDEILAIFADQAELWLSRLDPQSDDESWRNAAHALKGASRGVGAWRIGDLCEFAESLIGGAPDRTAQRKRVLAELNAGLAEALAEVRRIRAAA